jgi:hypothetical protein
LIVPLQTRKEFENEARFNKMLGVEATIRKRKRDTNAEVFINSLNPYLQASK